MKYLKYLIMLFVVSCIFCINGVKANVLDPYFFRHSCPPFNGSVETYTRVKDEDHTQELRWTKTTNELDVVLQDKNGNNVSPWKILKTGDDVIFNSKYSMLPGVEYKVLVDSRITYIYYTDFEFQWWVH